MTVNIENHEFVCDYQRPTEDHVAKIRALRKSSIALIRDILDLCPPSADQQAAVRKVREALMTANAAIVLDGEV